MLQQTAFYDFDRRFLVEVYLHLFADVAKDCPVWHTMSTDDVEERVASESLKFVDDAAGHLVKAVRIAFLVFIGACK